MIDRGRAETRANSPAAAPDGALRPDESARYGQAAALHELATPAGRDLLAEAASLPNDRLTRIQRLRKRARQELAAAAVSLLELRQRARVRFALADTMFFTPEGLEQATGDAIAAYRAGRFPPEAPLLDACSGIGGDAMHLAARGAVIAVDRDPAAAACAQLNCRAAKENTEAAPAVAGAGRVHVLCADVTALNLARLRSGGVSAVFCDPSRRRSDAQGERHRVRSGDEYAPPLRWAERLRAERFDAIGIKVSPAIDDGALQMTGASVEFVSDRGVCKEAIIWFGTPADSLGIGHEAEERYAATVLRANGLYDTLTARRSPPPDITQPQKYLYEPDAAVIRAHLTPLVAERLQAGLVAPDIAYLTSDRELDSPFATRYTVIDSLPYQVKEVQRRLRTLGARVVAVKKRGVLLLPETVVAALTPCGEREVVVTLYPLRGRTHALLCERPTSTESAEG